MSTVLGPNLWNILYDGELREEIPLYVDKVAVIRWVQAQEFYLSREKTEIVVLREDFRLGSKKRPFIDFSWRYI